MHLVIGLLANEVAIIQLSLIVVVPVVGLDYFPLLLEAARHRVTAPRGHTLSQRIIFDSITVLVFEDGDGLLLGGGGGGVALGGEGGGGGEVEEAVGGGGSAFVTL